MKPPLLQTAWHNRAFFADTGAKPWHEWFGVGVLCPSGQRAFWAWYGLGRPAGAAQPGRAEVAVQLCAGGDAPPRHLAEAYPATAVVVDPERAGMAVAQHSLGDTGLGGRLSGEAGTVAWQLELESRAAPWLPVPAGPLGETGLGVPGLSVPVLAGRARGYVETTAGEGRHRTVERLEVEGWRAFQWHRWGPPPAAPHALLFAELPGPAGTPPRSRLVALGSPWRLWPRAARPTVWARLWHEGEVLRFDSWRQLLGSPSQLHGAAWAFTVAARGTTLTCRVDLPAAAVASPRLEGLGGGVIATHEARLQAELARGGKIERLPLGTAACQLVC